MSRAARALLPAAALASVFSAILCAGSAQGADTLYALYAGGKYDEAIQAGLAAHSAAGYAIAARAVLADAALRDAPCLECLKRAENFARSAISADPHQADGHVWLAASLGLEGRITGLIMARVHNMPGEAKGALDVALKDAPNNPYALAAAGGWHIEIVRAGGAYLARYLYGATLERASALFDRAVHEAPGNVAVRYQIALSLAGFDADTYRARIENEWQAALHDTPNTEYEKALQGRAGELLGLLHRGNADSFNAKVRIYQGYPP